MGADSASNSASNGASNGSSNGSSKRRVRLRTANGNSTANSAANSTVHGKYEIPERESGGSSSLLLDETYNLTADDTIGFGRPQGAGNLSLRRPRKSKSTLPQGPYSGINKQQPFYSTYPATTALILVVHILYIKQIWTRKLSRRNLLVNYNQLVQQKRFHLAIGAMLSHAPTRSGSNSANMIERSRNTTTIEPPSLPADFDSYQDTSTRSISRQHGHDQGSPATSSRIAPFFFRINYEYGAAIVGPFGAGKPLSGLPLLFYCAHILWSCRALEVTFGSGWDYARVLFALTWTGLAIDLGITRMVLSMLRDMNFATASPFAMGARVWTSSFNGVQPVARHVERVLVQRSIGSLTMTTCAVLFVFRDHFDLAVPVIPVLSTELPILGMPRLSHTLVLVILLALSQPMHPIAGVACGTLAGLFWVSGWTSFLAEPYWSNGTVAAYVVLCLVTAKATNMIYIPCIDYVSWNSRGEMAHDVVDHQGFLSSTRTAASRALLLNTTILTGDDGDSTEEIGLSFGRHQGRRSSSSLDFLEEENYSDEEGETRDGLNSVNTGETTPSILLRSGSVNLGSTMRSRRPPSGESRL